MTLQEASDRLLAERFEEQVYLAETWMYLAEMYAAGSALRTDAIQRYQRCIALAETLL